MLGESNAFWTIPQTKRGYKDERTLNAITNNCSNYLSEDTKLKSFAKVQFRNTNDKLFHGMASLLQETMGNYTHHVDEYHQCRGRLHEISRYNKLFLTSDFKVLGERSDYTIYRLLTLPEQVTNLRFVSCSGDTGKQSIPFSELFVIYDIYVWVCLLLSSILLACVINNIPKTLQRYFKNLTCCSFI